MGEKFRVLKIRILLVNPVRRQGHQPRANLLSRRHENREFNFFMMQRPSFRTCSCAKHAQAPGDATLAEKFRFALGIRRRRQDVGVMSDGPRGDGIPTRRLSAARTDTERLPPEGALINRFRTLALKPKEFGVFLRPLSVRVCVCLVGDMRCGRGQ